MELIESFNGGAHGNIHGVLGGTWSPESYEYAAKTPDIVLPFVHQLYVSVAFLRKEGIVALVSVKRLSEDDAVSIAASNKRSMRLGSYEDPETPNTGCL